MGFYYSLYFLGGTECELKKLYLTLFFFHMLLSIIILKIVTGKNFMNQYFDRMKLLADNPDLQPRIRFMLKDVIDLRHDGWMPRKVAVVEGPMPINQIAPPHDDRPSMNFRRDRDSERERMTELFRHPLKTRGGLDDMLMGKCFDFFHLLLLDLLFLKFKTVPLYLLLGLSFLFL